MNFDAVKCGLLMPSQAFSHYKFFIVLSVIIIATRLILGSVGIYCRDKFLDKSESFPSWHYDSQYQFVNVWTVWDSGLYYWVAKNGYSQPYNDSKNNKVIPLVYSRPSLYPLMSRWLAIFTGDIIITGLLISNLCFLISAILLFYLVKMDWGEALATRTTIVYVLWPFSFVLSGYFAESLFNVLLFSVFICLRQNKVVTAGCLNSLSSITRTFGIFLIPLVAVHFYRKCVSLQKRIFEILIFSVLSCSLFAIEYFYKWRLSDSVFWLNEVNRFWGKNVGEGIISKLQGYLEFKGIFGYFELTVVLIIIFLSYFLAKEAKKENISNWIDFSLWPVFCLIPFLITGIPESYPRYTLAMFPLFLSVAIISHRYCNLYLVTFISFLLSCVLMGFWAISSLLVI